MNLPEFSVKRPVATAMFFLAVLLLGIVAFFRLPLDILPELELPSLTVITVYPGASAEEVEHDVTRLIEAVLSNTEHLSEIRSQSKENVSFITMVFDWNTDVTAAANNARDLLDLVGDRLPKQAYKPRIFKLNSNMLPVLLYGFTAEESFDDLERIIEDRIADPIRRIKGVGTLLHIGAPEQQYHVRVDPERLKGYNLSISQISTLLQAQTMSIPGGSFKVGNNEFAVRIPATVSSLHSLSESVISLPGGGSIKLSDVASVDLSNKDLTARARTMSGEGAAVIIQKQTGENTLDVVRRVRERMAELKDELPGDVEVDEIMFADEVVRESIAGLSSSLLYSLVFVTLVVLAMLRNWRQGLIILLTIPFSLITAFILMFSIGWSINIFSLMSLIIAMGMVVDNAIVVLENINQHLERGADRKEAAMFGAREMASAITASTLTTLMVFIPIVFMGGIVGVLFKQLAVLVSATLIASLITALALTPMLSSTMLHDRAHGKKREKRWLYRQSERFLVWLETIYSSTLAWAVHHKSFTLLAALIIFVLSLFLSRLVDTDYIPEIDAGDILINLQLDVSADVDKTDSVTLAVMRIIEEEVPERVPGTLSSVSGQTTDGTLTAVGFKEGKNIGTILCHLTLPNHRKRTVQEVADVISERIEKIPEIESFNIMRGSVLSAAIQGNKSPLEFELYGHDLQVLGEVCNKLREKVEATGYFSDVTTTRDPGKLEIMVEIDEQKANTMHLNAALIGLQVREALYGKEGGQISTDGRSKRIYIQYDQRNRNSVEDIQRIALTNLLGQQVSLGAVARIHLGQGVLQIDRKSQQRILRVKANLRDISLGTASRVGQELLSEMDLPEGVVARIDGQVAEQKSAFENLYLMLFLGIIMVYMVMAGQFESFIDPFIIMMAVPLTFIGVILAFFVTSTTLSVSAFIGLIMLMGIVVNNGIVLVDYTNLLRKRGYALEEAVREAGRSRLRPVLMTSLTTMLGMLPMAISGDMGRELYSPLGITMIGGLLVSTFITLLIVPTFYATIHQRDKIRGGLRIRAREG